MEIKEIIEGLNNRTGKYKIINIKNIFNEELEVYSDEREYKGVLVIGDKKYDVSFIENSITDEIVSLQIINRLWDKKIEDLIERIAKYFYHEEGHYDDPHHAHYEYEIWKKEIEIFLKDSRAFKAYGLIKALAENAFKEGSTYNTKYWNPVRGIHEVIMDFLGKEKIIIEDFKKNYLSPHL